MSESDSKEEYFHVELLIQGGRSHLPSPPRSLCLDMHPNPQWNMLKLSVISWKITCQVATFIVAFSETEWCSCGKTCAFYLFKTELSKLSTATSLMVSLQWQNECYLDTVSHFNWISFWTVCGFRPSALEGAWVDRTDDGGAECCLTSRFDVKSDQNWTYLYKCPRDRAGVK